MEIIKRRKFVLFFPVELLFCYVTLYDQKQFFVVGSTSGDILWLRPRSK